MSIDSASSTYGVAAVTLREESVPQHRPVYEVLRCSAHEAGLGGNEDGGKEQKLFYQAVFLLVCLPVNLLFTVFVPKGHSVRLTCQLSPMAMRHSEKNAVKKFW